MNTFHNKNWFGIKVVAVGAGGCEHKDFGSVLGPNVGGTRKRTVTCNGCGRSEIQRPYARQKR